jgi:hypothetical protein
VVASVNVSTTVGFTPLKEMPPKGSNPFGVSIL